MLRKVVSSREMTIIQERVIPEPSKETAQIIIEQLAAGIQYIAGSIRQDIKSFLMSTAKTDSFIMFKHRLSDNVPFIALFNMLGTLLTPPETSGKIGKVEGMPLPVWFRYTSQTADIPETIRSRIADYCSYHYANFMIMKELGIERLYIYNDSPSRLSDQTPSITTNMLLANDPYDLLLFLLYKVSTGTIRQEYNPHDYEYAPLRIGFYKLEPPNLKDLEQLVRKCGAILRELHEIDYRPYMQDPVKYAEVSDKIFFRMSMVKLLNTLSHWLEINIRV